MESKRNFWYGSKRGNLHRGTGSPHVNQTLFFLGLGRLLQQQANPTQPTDPSTQQTHHHAAAVLAGGDGRLRQLGRHRLEPNRGTPIPPNLLNPSSPFLPLLSPSLPLLSLPALCPSAERASLRLSLLGSRGDGAEARNSTRRMQPRTWRAAPCCERPPRPSAAKIR